MTVRFGDFELDIAGYRLTKGRIDIRLGKQPLDLLILLVTHQGQLITRERIRTELWGDTFVDSEHGTNSAMRKIRAALSDDSAAPKYVETVVGRGYRFIAPVVIAGVMAEEVVMTEEEAPAPAIVPEPAEYLPQTPKGRPSYLRLALSGIAIASALGLTAVVLLSLGGHRWLQGAPPQLAWKPITKAINLVNRITSDGKYIYWNEFGDSGCRPWQAPLDGGGEPSPVHLPFSSSQVTDATADGHLLLTVLDYCNRMDKGATQGAIWELTVASGMTRRVGNLTGRDAVYSPDGSHIALGKWDEIWITDRDGSELRRIARVPGAIVAIHWSPDGKLLRFTVQGKTEIRFVLWEAEIDSGKAMPITPDLPKGADVLDGAWTRDGQFVFGVKRQAGTDLWRMTPNAWSSSSHSAQQLTHGPLEFFQPVAIPGSGQLAVVGVQRQGELQRFDSRAGRFVPLLNGISAEMADFSRDGKWVVYVTYPERELWRSRTDGSQALQLTHGSLRAGLPRISPDGSQVAFTGDYSGRDLRTWIVPLDGGQPRRAAPLAEGEAEVAPTWSGDGKKLLFRLDLALLQNVLAILDLESGKIERIPGSEHMYNQRWSPDGKWIVATPNTNKGLYLFDVARREWNPLSEMHADYPSWSHDSEYVYYCTELDGGEEAIYRISLVSRKPERVTTLVGTMRAFNDIYSQWTGLAADDSPTILRGADLQRIYLLSLSGN